MAPIRMISYGNGFILQSNKYSRENAGNSLKNYILLKKGEFAYNHGASKNKPYGVCYYLQESEEARIPFVYHAFSINGDKDYWNYALNTQYVDKQLKRIVSSGARMDGLLNISYDDYMSIKMCVPILNEQHKIGKLLSSIDKRITSQNKIIDGYKSLIKSISLYLFNDINDTIKLSRLCKITTGKLDANQMIENGQYPFFTCGRETLQIDKYAFDCEAILIAGNGDIGHTKYYEGKFNAYQRTYILYNFNANAKYVKYAIDLYLPQKVKEETQSSAMPYIKLGTLADLELPFTDMEQQNKIVTILTTIERKLETEIELLTKLKEQKKYLLSNMFI